MAKWIKIILWIVYAALLIVLLPHTAWAFNQFEADKWRWVGWLGALAFEGAIAALTWRLAQRLESTPNYSKGWVWGRKFSFRYLNVYGGGLLVVVAVSSLANWSHAVQFGLDFAAFADYDMPPLLYSVAFGAILPVCSLLFAHILADTTETEQEENQELTEAKATIRELRQDVRAAEQRAELAEQRFQAIGDLAILLTAENKRQRILAARQWQPELPAASIAIITKASPSYVSEVLTAPEPETEQAK